MPSCLVRCLQLQVGHVNRIADPAPDAAPQRVIKVRRDYNAWVARETMEDYALRFTPRVVPQVVGAARGQHGVRRGVVPGAGGGRRDAAGAVRLRQRASGPSSPPGSIIFLAGLPISVYAARHGVDMDLLTRGAGFGYIGSTITSLIYASFTFIFFALEAAIMAYALELAFDIPPAWGYLLCALVVIPLVTHGVTAISRLQVWTQPLWLVLLVLPFVYVLRENPGAARRPGALRAARAGRRGAFDLLAVRRRDDGGHRADHADGRAGRLPALHAREDARAEPRALVGRRADRRARAGSCPACRRCSAARCSRTWRSATWCRPTARSTRTRCTWRPTSTCSRHYGWAVAATALFVVVSQLKINVTNAYAGSLAWSNFFARLTHSHPGRVVWVVFNTLIALMLMELDVFQAHRRGARACTPTSRSPG